MTGFFNFDIKRLYSKKKITFVDYISAILCKINLTVRIEFFMNVEKNNKIFGQEKVSV